MRSVSALPSPLPVQVNSSAEESLTLSGLAALSDDGLIDEITTWGGRIAAGEARLLAYVGELDARRGWAVTGIRSCAHWLSWKLGMGVSAAYERVRVARALRDLPLTFAEFAAGRLSFTQARAITRMACAADEDMFVELARFASGEQIERLAGGIRRARRFAADEAQRRSGRVNPNTGDLPTPRTPTVSTRYDDNGDLTVVVKVAAAAGAIVLAALDAVRSDLDTQTRTGSAAEAAEDSSAEESPPARTSQGEGFIGLCQAYLDERARAHPDRARRDRAKLTVQVDPVSGWVRLPDGELLSPQIAAAEGLTLPAASVLRRLTVKDLIRHDLGRSRRKADQPLRDLLTAVDGYRCRFRTCRRHRKLHAHHVIGWTQGGGTDLSNLIWLCGHHHTVVHQDGFQLTLHARSRRLTITTKDGVDIPDECPIPWQPAPELDPSDSIRPHTLPPHVPEKLDLHYAVNTLLYNTRLRVDAHSQAAA